MKVDFRSLTNNTLTHLTPYQPGKPIEELERELGITSSIKLASNENPLGASEKVFQTASRALEKIHIYPDSGCFEIKQALAHFLSICPEQITMGNGSENILELIVKAYLSKEYNAVISQYVFLTIPIILQSYGIDTHVVPARHWGHDIEKMAQAIDKKTRVLFLVNPNNPTGTYTTEGEFLQLMQSVPQHILVVVDEAYAEYMTQKDYPNTLSYLTRYPNLIITRTFSKAYGLAALRLGYAISSPNIADILNRVRLPFNVNAIAATAACAALEDQHHIKKTLMLNQQGMKQLAAGLQTIGRPYIPSAGNFITIDVGDAAHIYQQLLHKGVIVRPLTAYTMPRHIRVTIGTSAQNTRFLTAMNVMMPSITKNAV